MTDPIIGTLNEHTLHLALKHYLEPDPAFHEVPCLGYVADILRDGAITEVETRSFANIRRKLAAFLGEYDVTVVYPVAVKKWVVWIDPETGEMSERHKSPKKGRPSDVLIELLRLSDFLTNPRFRLRLIFLETEEYKRRDGWSRDGKRGATRQERVPLSFLGELLCERPRDYEKLVETIPEGSFTAAEFAAANRLRGRFPWYALKILEQVGVIERDGLRGRAFLYRRRADDSIGRS